MFEKFVALESANFKQRYQGTFGFFRKGDKKILVRLDAIVTGEDRALVEFTDRNGMKYKLYSDSDDETIGFEFLPPKSQYYDTTDGTFLIKRVAARQYQRGICERNTAIQSVGGRPQTVGFDVLHLIYDNEVDHAAKFGEVCSHDYDGERGFALSGQFAVSLDRGQIYCLGTAIGTARLRYGKLNIKLDDSSMWRTEVNDCLNRTGIKGVLL